MCEFQIGTVECRGDGYLWDADNDGFDPNEHDHPCPCCNTGEYLKSRKEDAETTSSFAGAFDSGTGIDIWTRAVKTARRWNAKAAKSALSEIGRVEAIADDESKPDGYRVRVFEYPGRGQLAATGG